MILSSEYNYMFQIDTATVPASHTRHTAYNKLFQDQLAETEDN